MIFDVRIANITRTGLITVEYNKPTVIVNEHLEVVYQMNQEEKANVTMNWTLVEQEARHLKIQMNFNKPLQVSQGDILDLVLIKLPVLMRQHNSVDKSIVFYNLRESIPL